MTLYNVFYNIKQITVFKSTRTRVIHKIVSQSSVKESRKFLVIWKLLEKGDFFNIRVTLKDYWGHTTFYHKNFIQKGL